MSEGAINIIHQAMQKKPTGLEAAFKEAIKPMVANQISAKKTQVGSNMFKAVESKKE